MWWWPIDISLCVLGGKIPWKLSTSLGQYIFYTIIWYHRWKFQFVPEGWSLFTPSWRQQSSYLLLLKIFAPFLLDRWGRRGFIRGHKPPSSSRYFPLGQFRLFPHRTWRDVVASLDPSPIINLPTGTWSVIGGRAVLPWPFASLSPRRRRCSVWRVLGFIRNFWYQFLVLGRSPLSGGNNLGYTLGQTHVPSGPGSPTWS